MKKNKILIVIMVMLIIIIVAIMSLIKVLQKSIIIDEEEFEYTEEILNEQEISRVKNNDLFYTIENCLQKYESYLNLNYEKQVDELNMPSIAALYNISTEEEKAKALMNLLDKEYISENKINSQNILEILNNSFDEVNVKAIKINKLIDDNAVVEAYTILAKIDNGTNASNKMFIIKIDNSNSAFCVTPIDDGKYKDIDQIEFINRTKQIEKNDNNKYVNISYNEGQIAANYFQEYKELILGDYELAYEKLDEEYRKIKFGDLEKFKQYIQENTDIIKKMQVYKYQTEIEDSYTEYRCMKLDGGYWIIRENAPRDYTVLLDTYTIDLPEFITKYNNNSDEIKTGLNIQKIFDSIKDGDYSYAYKKLDETFKQNNFPTEELFKKYAKQYLLGTTIEHNDCETSGELFIYDITITQEDNKTVNKTIIMKLLEGTDFVFSFDV